MLHRVLKRTIAQRVLWKCCEEFCKEVLGKSAVEKCWKVCCTEMSEKNDN